MDESQRNLSARNENQVGKKRQSWIEESKMNTILSKRMTDRDPRVSPEEGSSTCRSLEQNSNNLEQNR